MKIRRALASTLVLVAATATHAAATTWLVPGNGTNTCTTVSPNCNTIAQAVTASANGDAINVAAGNFPVTGVIALTKTLTITGNGIGSTIVQPSAGITAFSVRTNNVTLQDLTIQNGGVGVNFANTASDNTVIQNVAFSGQTVRGIDVATTAAQPVTNVQVLASTFSTASVGIRMASNTQVTGFIVDNCTFTGNVYGIYQANDGNTSRLSGLIVDASTFTNNSGYAIYVEEIRDSKIDGSFFTDNGKGIQVNKIYANPAALPVANVLIQRNEFSGTKSNAIDFEVVSSALESAVTIQDNIITQDVGLIGTNRGTIFVALSPSFTHAMVHLIGNFVTLSGTFTGGATAVHGIAVAGNGPLEISASQLDGGLVGGTGTNPPTSGVYIQSRGPYGTMPATTTIIGACNRVLGFVNGVSVYDSVASAYGGLPAGTSVAINDSSIRANSAAGVVNGATPTLDFTGNWWGCPAGPGNPGCDTVVGGVTTSPVASAPPPCVSCQADADCDDTLFCNGTETCSSNACVAGGGDPCLGGDVCGNVCDEAGDTCILPSGVPCRPSAGPCDVAETCDGVSPSCPGNGFASPTTLCRAAVDECDANDFCPGGGSACAADAKKAGGTACTTDGNPCTLDQCDGSSDACQHPAGNAGAVCRTANGVCDVAETCDGASTSCPADGFAPATTLCRAAAGECDVADFCPGSGPACAADGKKTSGTACTSDGSVCTLDQCNGSSNGCQHPAGNAGAVCRAASDVCDVTETCDGASPSCPADGFAPATTECRAAADQCDVAETCTGGSAACPVDGVQPDGTTCDDGVACTIDDVCTAGTCGGNSITCGDGITQGACGELCDDGNVVSNDGCSATCQPEFVCTPAPIVGCRTAMTGKSQLQLRNKTPDTKDQGRWKWNKGQTTPKADFGAPLTATGYQLCIYANGSLVSRAAIPAGGLCAGKACWRENSKGFQYKDKDATPDGVTKLKLREGLVDGKAQIQLQGKGMNIDMPTLPLAQPVRVQIKNSDGVCWETTHSAPASKNDATQFNDKND